MVLPTFYLPEKFQIVDEFVNFHNPDLMPVDALTIAMTVLSGLCWTIAYILIIYKGFRDKTAGMPLMVLGMNLAWEFLFAFVWHMQTKAQIIVNVIWFLFDCVIVYLKFKYGKDEFHAALPGMSDKWFYPYLITIMFWSFVLVWSCRFEFNDLQGAYAAYIQNIFISSLYIPMLFRKGSTAGQSMYIAIFKCIGTLAPDVCGAYAMVMAFQKLTGCSVWEAFCGALTITWHPLLKFLILGCLFFDIIYMVCLYKKFKEEGKNPWSIKA